MAAGAEEFLERIITTHLTSTLFDRQLHSIQENLHHSSFSSLCASLRHLWQHLTDQTGTQYEDIDSSLQWSKVAADFAWEQLNSGDWKDVPVQWRQTYSLACLLTAMALVRKDRFREALVEVDKGLLMGAPVLGDALQSLATVLTAELREMGSSRVTGAERSSREIKENQEGTYIDLDIKTSLTERDSNVCDSATDARGSSISSMEGSTRKVVFKNYKVFQQRQESSPLLSSTERTHTDSTEQPSTKRPKTEEEEETRLINPQSSISPSLPLPGESTVSDPPLTVHGGGCVPVVNCPSLETFLQRFMLTSTPVVVSGAMELWPAYSGRKWSLSHLKEVAGPRTVPVELGSRYTDEEWSQKLMTIADFIDNYITLQGANSPKGYLAQHKLFDQIPELHDDILTPEYCCLRTEEDPAANTGDSEGTKVNAWFGPKGTVSPLHHDPEHNLLAQVMGRKYIRLYSKDQTPYLYPHEGLLTNTSKVDVERPDMEQFPLFREAVAQECTLQPGQMLYIPPKCWHYVRSLDTSFSVSFWWS